MELNFHEEKCTGVIVRTFIAVDEVRATRNVNTNPKELFSRRSRCWTIEHSRHGIPRTLPSHRLEIRSIAYNYAAFFSAFQPPSIITIARRQHSFLQSADFRWKRLNLWGIRPWRTNETSRKEKMWSLTDSLDVLNPPSADQAFVFLVSRDFVERLIRCRKEILIFIAATVPDNGSRKAEKKHRSVRKNCKASWTNDRIYVVSSDLDE